MKPNQLTEQAAMSAAHTPGPWHDYEHSQESFMIVGDRENAVAHICRTGRRKTDEANAHLIAAAPSLLAALKNAVAQFDFTVAALAKGQTVSISSLQNCAAVARAAIAKTEGAK